jgi:hypothetical protein
MRKQFAIAHAAPQPEKLHGEQSKAPSTKEAPVSLLGERFAGTRTPTINPDRFVYLIFPFAGAVSTRLNWFHFAKSIPIDCNADDAWFLLSLGTYLGLCCGDI